jgi:hypothetical protein
MAGPKTDALVKSVQRLVAERQAVAAREKQLVLRLGAALMKIGYRVMPMDSGAPEGPTMRRGRRLARRRMSAAARRAVSQRMKAYWAKRRDRTANAKTARRGRRRAAKAGPETPKRRRGRPRKAIG